LALAISTVGFLFILLFIFSLFLGASFAYDVSRNSFLDNHLRFASLVLSKNGGGNGLEALASGASGRGENKSAGWERRDLLSIRFMSLSILPIFTCCLTNPSQYTKLWVMYNLELVGLPLICHLYPISGSIDPASSLSCGCLSSEATI
jgi:hypothetical protein